VGRFVCALGRSGDFVFGFEVSQFVDFEFPVQLRRDWAI
jgi:hypothetical protein